MHRNLVAAIAAIALPLGSWAETDRDRVQEDRIASLERTVEVLADELERVRTVQTVPDSPELKSVYGAGPAASKVYGISRGLSIGGYAEGFYRNFVSDEGTGVKDTSDMLRTVLYTGFKFTDNILFNAEFEWEHGTSSATESAGTGSISAEFAALDFLYKPWLNTRVGLLLVPMGFLNEVHEPPFFFGVGRPDVEQQIIPSTWRENGVGIFGGFFGDQLAYKAYVVNGLNAEGFRAGGLRGGRQSGNRALAEHLAFVGKLDWTPIPQLLLGGSVYLGKSGQNQNVLGIDLPDTPTRIYEAHGQFRSRGLHLRGLFAMAHVGDARDLSLALAPTAMGGTGELAAGEAVARAMLGGYAEIAYDVMRVLFPQSEKSFEPFFRFEYVDTQNSVPKGFSVDERKRIQNYTAGFSFKPIPNVVIKTDYRNRVAERGALADEFNLGFGLAF